jgi:hypothetical protein
MNEGEVEVYPTVRDRHLSASTPVAMAAAPTAIC